MADYKKEVDGNATILYRIKKDGTLSEQLRVIQGKDIRTLFLTKYNKDKFIIKDPQDNIITGFVKVGNNVIADFTGIIKLYTRPHYQELHNVIMAESRGMYSLYNARYKQKMQVDDIVLDDNGILQNMLEYVATI